MPLFEDVRQVARAQAQRLQIDRLGCHLLMEYQHILHDCGGRIGLSVGADDLEKAEHIVTMFSNSLAIHRILSGRTTSLLWPFP